MPLTADERESLIRQYGNGPKRLRDAFGQVPKEAWQWRPETGKWSVHEIVCHCADSEMNAAARIRFMLTEENPLIQGYDQDRWARVLNYHSARVDLALATVDVVRASTVNLLTQLPETAWKIVGRHTEQGTYSTEDWLRTYAEHLEKHSRQIERNLEAWRAEETKPGV